MYKESSPPCHYIACCIFCNQVRLCNCARTIMMYRNSEEEQNKYTNGIIVDSTFFFFNFFYLYWFEDTIWSMASFRCTPVMHDSEIIP